MILHVTAAKYLDNYRVQLSFSDGRNGVADLNDSLEGTVFAPLKDKSFFAKLKLDQELNTIIWPNGVDLAPEYLYFKSFKDVKELKQVFKTWGYIT